MTSEEQKFIKNLVEQLAKIRKWREIGVRP
jgi:hypothetical protein